jgi:hypothetical protein
MPTPMQILLAMEDYDGSREQCMTKSVSVIRANMGISEAKAHRTIQSLLQSGAVRLDIKVCGKDFHGYPRSCWRWVARPREALSGC